MCIRVWNIRKYTPLFAVVLVLVLTIALLFFSLPLVGARESLSEIYAPVFSTSTRELPVIILDAGHGGSDGGACGINGVLEKDLNLAFAKQIGAALRSAGFAVVYTREDDRMLCAEEERARGLSKISDLKRRCEIASSYPGSLFVSVHMNSFGQSKYHGLQVFHAQGAPSFSLAQAIQTQVRATVQPDNTRQVKEGRDIYIMEHAPGTAVLVECGFLSNDRECARLCEQEYQRSLSTAIACGIVRYARTMHNTQTTGKFYYTKEDWYKT